MNLVSQTVDASLARRLYILFRMRGWHQTWIVCGLLTFTFFAQTEASAQSEGTYSLSVAVNEVSLTFHAEDAHGLPVNDLKIDDLSLLDNGKAPRLFLELNVDGNLHK